MADSKSITRENVALGMVSKVVNGSPVGKRYQHALEEAIDKLGYQVRRQDDASCKTTDRRTTDRWFFSLEGYRNPRRGWRYMCAFGNTLNN